MKRNKNPMVTVVTGYYNRLENLEDSISSVLNQSYENFEYIVFDDCSTDGTREKLEKFDDPRLKLIKHDFNMGFTKGIINAIAESQGELIAVHGAGDISLPDRIKKQVELLVKDKDVGIVGCLVEDISREKKQILNPDLWGDKSLFTGGEVMYRKSLYYRAGGYNALFYFGQFTPLKMGILKLAKPAYVNEILYRRIHYGNGVSKNKTKKIRQQIFYTVGMDIEKLGFFNIDFSGIIIEKTLNNLSLLKPGSIDEFSFIQHSKKRKVSAWIFYKLYKLKLLPDYPLKRIAYKMRKKRLQENEKLKGKYY